MPIGLPPREDTYFIDPEDATEMARLLLQGRLISQNMGSLLPDGLDLEKVHDVLDMACGPGGWVHDVAFAYPEMQVTGVDISQKMIDYANALAWSQRLENASFKIMNLLKPLEFPEHSFDLVNGRLLMSFMPKTAWPGLLQECMRILRPGGIVRLTEADNFGLTNSPAYKKLNRMMVYAMHKAGQTFSPEEDNFGVVPMLGYFLKQAGCTHIQQKAHIVDYSYDTEAHDGWYENFTISFQLLQPFLIKMEVTTPEEVTSLYKQAREEMVRADFRAVWLYLSVWGQKPEA
jgi:ubiquinone/menaquinone biosynthesis C-methylase UbiE